MSGHEVGDGAERGEIGEIEPKGLACPARHRAHAEELEGDTRTGEITRRHVGSSFGSATGTLTGTASPGS